MNIKPRANKPLNMVTYPLLSCVKMFDSLPFILKQSISPNDFWRQILGLQPKTRSAGVSFVGGLLGCAGHLAVALTGIKPKQTPLTGGRAVQTED